MALRPAPVEPRGGHSNSAQSLAAESSSASVSSIILVVDPAVSRCRSATAVLRGLGHQFVEARDTAEALSYLARNQVDLVIADLWFRMKGRQNFAALSGVRSERLCYRFF